MLASLNMRAEGTDVELIVEIPGRPQTGEVVTPKQAKWGDHQLLGKDLLVIADMGDGQVNLGGQFVDVALIQVQCC